MKLRRVHLFPECRGRGAVRLQGENLREMNAFQIDPSVYCHGGLSCSLDKKLQRYESKDGSHNLDEKLQCYKSKDGMRVNPVGLGQSSNIRQMLCDSGCRIDQVGRYQKLATGLELGYYG
ncbi:hypothetical protein R1flu_001173 [Riccia fluitans]|uniref:Uncharacterized protein n=1 Tax=Riccia fluitans TaxID=41844 RepID=A0ABD1Y2H9_9MARC